MPGSWGAVGCPGGGSTAAQGRGGGGGGAAAAAARPPHSTKRSSATPSLSPQSEAELRQLFTLDSELSDAKASAVSARTGCTADQALAFIHSLHRASPCWASTPPPAAREALLLPGTAAMAAVLKAATVRQAASRRLEQLIDQGSGGLRDPSVTGAH